MTGYWREYDYEDDDEDLGQPCMFCGERGCPGYDCNEEEYNMPGRYETDEEERDWP